MQNEVYLTFTQEEIFNLQNCSKKYGVKVPHFYWKWKTADLAIVLARKHVYGEENVCELQHQKLPNKNVLENIFP